MSRIAFKTKNQNFPPVIGPAPHDLAGFVFMTVMRKRRAVRRKKTARSRVMKVKELKFTLREFATIMIYSQNMMHGINYADAVTHAGNLAKTLQSLRLGFKDDLIKEI